MARKKPDHTQIGPESQPVQPADPFRETGDTYAWVPLHALDPAPFNRKTPIHGKYRKGLAGGLEHFGVRDALKVWPKPGEPGRYLALDGNQRLDVLRELAEKQLFEAEFGAGWTPPGPAEQCDDRTRRRVQELKLRAGDKLIECRVLADLDRDDAELFNASFDRNRAKHDEHKLADLVEEQKHRSRALLDVLLRAQRPFVPPPRKDPAPEPGDSPEAIAASLDAIVSGSAAAATPDPDQPWGPPPAPEPRPGGPAELIPVMFSLSPEAHAELIQDTLRAKARLIRNARLGMAVKALADTAAEAGLDDAVVELALLVYQRRLPVASPAEA